MFRDRFVLSLLTATMLLAGVVGLYWPTSLDQFDRWGFRIYCGSGLVADYGQAARAADADPAAVVPVQAGQGRNDYVGQCSSATWWRRAWAWPLVLSGAALSVALLLGFQRWTPSSTRPDDG